MPYCMNCGTKLPEGAKFCMECGTPLGGVAPEAARPAPQPQGGPGPAPQPKVPAQHTRGCSQKQGNLIRVNGDGLYFLDWGGDSLYRLGEGEKKPKKLNRRVAGCEMEGLNYWRGGLYYLRSDIEGNVDLLRYDTATGKKDEIRRMDRLLGYIHSVGMVIYDGVLYAHGADQECITTLELSTMKEGGIPLPDLRSKPLPQDWLEQERYMVDNNSGERSYGQQYEGLYVLDGAAYVSIGGASYMNIRIPLDDPENFTFLPYDSCCAMHKYGALALVKGDRILGTGCLRKTLYLTDMKTGKKGEAVPNLHTNGFGWWRMGSRYFLEGTAVDLRQMKRYHLPYRLDAQDFVSDGGIGVWVLSRDGGLYFLAPEIWSFKSQEELERYRVLTLDD